MAIPRTIDIFGQKWKIKVTSEMPDHLAGLCLKQEKQILINKSMPKHEIMPTLLHEIFHALFNRVSLDQAITAEIKEIVVDNIANWLCENTVMSFKK